ncbi:hypothetical protein BEN47_07225 [Hymenobacter lapidarius]|uniref:N-methyl-D-aspartate receptor NMDAR2C subunit n=1 Tax=Hymenobacter lapidarius TaxID=1908237 RepID=A0A1G1TEX3_9BACT|nr:hypothetical protein [Hymenobacter lapidarius]OGX89422.1 hypothetical protein BEN47_07225 [Hymenobacter lapidarius]
MAYSENELAARWHQLTAPLVPDAGLRESRFRTLAAAYQGPTRHYHTLQHIENMLKRLDGATLQDAAAVELAVWFHDAVYNALKSDNEARSAALALDFLRASTLAPVRQQRVAFLIARTHDHTQPQPPDDFDLLHFLDADLSILGAPAADYWAYARQVRQEYRLVPELLYRPGRRKVLAKMLAAPVLYHTPALRQELDAQARHNLRAELAAWESGGLVQMGK